MVRFAFGVGLAIMIGVVCYGLGHRQGRGAACFEVAINTRVQDGRSLRSALLSRPGATSEYSFWGTHCTITVSFPTTRGRDGGHWRYDLERAALYTDDDPAATLLPAGGRWTPQGGER